MFLDNLKQYLKDPTHPMKGALDHLGRGVIHIKTVDDVLDFILKYNGNRDGIFNFSTSSLGGGSVRVGDGPREVEYRKNSIWNEKWNDKDVWTRLVKVDGREDIVINIHQHEINDEVTKRNIHYLPDNVSVSPSVYYKDILNDLFAKKEYLYVNNLKFPSVDADKFVSHKDQFIPIPDSFTLINEGKSLKHCIGQEKYISWGSLGECMYFRYIPSGMGKDDYKAHFTVTLFKTEIHRFPTKDELALQALSNVPVYQDEDEDVWQCAIDENLNDCKKQVYFLREVWGWDNEVPEEDNLLEIYDFLYQNQKLFTL